MRLKIKDLKFVNFAMFKFYISLFLIPF